MRQILSQGKVVQLVGMSRTTIWRRERAGDFPERIYLGGRRVGWDSHEIDQWLKDRPRGINPSL